MRLLTKEQRNQSREYQFTQLLTAGFIRTDYKDRVFFHHPEQLLFKAFKGNAANHYHYVKYRSIERLMEDIEHQKGRADINEEWKAQQKERNKGKSSSHAATAAAIKAELKAVFPFCKFSVTSDSYSGGDSVRIHWTDGVTSSEVEKITNKYQYGHFDGMTDMYESSNSRDDIPQVKFVSESRSISDSVKAEVSSQLAQLMNFESRDLEDTTRRIISKTAIPHQYTAIRVCRNNQTAGSGWESFFYLEFDGVPQQQEEQTRPAAPQIAPDQISVIKYSEKAIAVIGNTKPIKDTLKELGGSFNPRLSCGAGWIFPVTKQAQVIEMLKGMKAQQETVKEELREEIQKTVDFFKETDIKIYGQLQPCTMQIVRVQKGESANV